MGKYIDFLEVRTLDGGHALLVAEAHLVHEGDWVEFGGGKFGKVIAKAWAGDRNGELHTIISRMRALYEVDAVYTENWRQGAPEGQTDDA